MEYRQIQRRTAKKLYNEGKEIFLRPCNFNTWVTGIKFYSIKKDQEDFESKVGYFTFLNCNSRLGRYPHFFIKLD